MTFSELLDKSASELEKMSDLELMEYLAPCLKDCSPIDIQIVNESEAKIKLEKLAKKNFEKEQRKQERLIAKTAKIVNDSTQEPRLVKPARQKVTTGNLTAVNAMIEMMRKNLEAQQGKKI